jgi:hypothetical protein
VNKFAAESSWLGESADWKTRFTLACAMQNVCDVMDDYFKELFEDSSLKLANIIKRITGEGIACDDENILADSHRFFATRLWQLKIKRDKNWDKMVAPPKASKSEKFPEFVSIEEDERIRNQMFRQMNPGNRFLEAIMRMSTSDGCFRGNDFSAQNFIALDKYLFELGVHELNCMIKKKRKGAGKR